MIIITTAILFHVMAKHGIIWEGVVGTWMIAAILDAALIAFFIWARYQPQS